MRLPDTVAFPPEKSTVAFLMVAVPVVAPIVRVVAALAKLTVVAVVSTRSKLVEPVVKEVVIAGEVPNTKSPAVPVSSETESARLAEVIVVARLDDASVVTSLEAVRSGRLTTDEPESIIMLPVVVPPRVNVNIAVD